MRYKGQQLKGPKRETLVIPRENQEDIVFQAEAVMDFDDFEIICPPPSPPNKLIPGDPPRQIPNSEDPKYKTEIRDWATKKQTWVILKSLSVTQDLEWEQVDINNPDTYELYMAELKDAGFNNAELQLIVGLALKVNSVDEDKMEEARQRFLARSKEQVVPQ